MIIIGILWFLTRHANSSSFLINSSEQKPFKQISLYLIIIEWHVYQWYVRWTLFCCFLLSVWSFAIDFRFYFYSFFFLFSCLLFSFSRPHKIWFCCYLFVFHLADICLLSSQKKKLLKTNKEKFLTWIERTFFTPVASINDESVSRKLLHLHRLQFISFQWMICPCSSFQATNRRRLISVFSKEKEKNTKTKKKILCFSEQFRCQSFLFIWWLKTNWNVFWHNSH